jgi:hypothetical protein
MLEGLLLWFDPIRKIIIIFFTVAHGAYQL